MTYIPFVLLFSDEDLVPFQVPTILRNVYISLHPQSQYLYSRTHIYPKSWGKDYKEK